MDDYKPSSEVIEGIANAICQARMFETGEGGCAARCMGVLGESRNPKCPYAAEIHKTKARNMLPHLHTAGLLAPEWQPIETARDTLRDSKSRLVWCPEHQNTYEVCWADEKDSWVVFGDYTSSRLNEQPTHWMPLPTPPKQEPS